jgi:DNA uptake protein ComE-like DNA-binding protein
MATPPQLSTDQRAAALAKAALVRVARSELKEKLKAGEMSLQDVIDAAVTDDVAAKLKVLTMLESLPGLGKVKARRIMDEVGIADSRRVKGLGAQQRAALLQQLG